MSKAKRCVVAGFVLCLTVAGCVTMGGSNDRLAKSDEVPLVPLPPFPNGRAESKAAPPSAAPPSKAEVKSDEPPTAPTSPAPPSPPPPKAVKIVKDDRPAPRHDYSRAVRKLIETAQSRVASLDSYIVRLTRREQVGDRGADAEQLILFKFRKRPWSVHLKWLGKECNGREVLYVKGQHQGKIHSRLAAGDAPFMPAGKRLALAPDNPLVKSATRHPITEAGILANVDRLAAVQAALERGDRKQGTLTVRTGVERPEFSKPASAIEHVLPPGVDPSLPKGGTRTYYFHPDNGLPMLIRTVDESDKEVEYYRYDRLQAEVKLDDADFDPKALFGDK